MKCPNCGFDNRIDAKFCSECAYKLTNVANNNIGFGPADDEVLSDELVALWKLYEEDQLDVALERIADVKKNLSGSSSIYSLAALIYEKRAAQQLDRGDLQAYYDDLASAVKEYEEVVRQNPRSAADRAKLLALRHKLSLAKKKSDGVDKPRILQLLGSVPLPIWAAVVVFVLVIGSSLVIRGVSGKADKTQGNVSPAQVTVRSPYNAQPYQYNYQAPQQQQPQYQPQPQQPSGGVYNYQQPPANRPAQREPTPNERRAYAERQQPYDAGSERTLAPLEPMPLPSSVRVVPSQEQQKKADSGQSTAPQIHVTPSAGGQNSPEISVQIQQDRSEQQSDDPDSWLARALQFEKQGFDSYARAAAERAQTLYLRDLADGKNTENSANGIELTKGVLKKLDNKKQ